MSVKGQVIVSNIYTSKEGFNSTYPWFKNLKENGLMPHYIVMDGEQSVIRAINLIWPYAKIQRCLYHIQSQGLSWLRTYPKTVAARELRTLLLSLCSIRSIKERDQFIQSYKAWVKKYKDFVKSLPVTTVAFKDLKRTMSLINNALLDMFHYLTEPNIPATTNAIESFYSRLKGDYRRHRGLSQKHKSSYLKWYCFLKNSNTN